MVEKTDDRQIVCLYLYNANQLKNYTLTCITDLVSPSFPLGDVSLMMFVFWF